MSLKSQQITIIRAYKMTDNPRIRRVLVSMMWPLVKNFVFRTVQKLNYNPQEEEDLNQQCVTILGKSMQDFDATTGYNFTTFFVWRIIESTMKYNYRNNLINPIKPKKTHCPDCKYEFDDSREIRIYCPVCKTWCKAEKWVFPEMYSINKPARWNNRDLGYDWVDVLKVPESPNITENFLKIANGALTKCQKMALQCRITAEQYGLKKKDFYNATYGSAHSCEETALTAIKKIRKILKFDILIAGNIRKCF